MIEAYLHFGLVYRVIKLVDFHTNLIKRNQPTKAPHHEQPVEAVIDR